MGTPKIEVVRFDQNVQNDLGQLQSRRRELSAQLRIVNHEMSTILAGLGVVVVKGGDWQSQTERLLYLRAESEALGLAVDYCDLQSENLKRFNNWAR